MGLSSKPFTGPFPSLLAMTLSELMSSHHSAIQPIVFPVSWAWHVATDVWQAGASLLQPYPEPPRSQAQQSTDPEPSWQEERTLSTQGQGMLDTECDHTASLGLKQGQSLFSSAFKRQHGSNSCLFLSPLVSSCCLQLVWSGIQRMEDVIVSYHTKESVSFLKTFKDWNQWLRAYCTQSGSCVTSIALREPGH